MTAKGDDIKTDADQADLLRDLTEISRATAKAELFGPTVIRRNPTTSVYWLMNKQETGFSSSAREYDTLRAIAETYRLEFEHYGEDRHSVFIAVKPILDVENDTPRIVEPTSQASIQAAATQVPGKKSTYLTTSNGIYVIVKDGFVILGMAITNRKPFQPHEAELFMATVEFCESSEVPKLIKFVRTCDTPGEILRKLRPQPKPIKPHHRANCRCPRCFMAHVKNGCRVPGCKVCFS